MKNKNLLPLLAVAGGLYLANQTGSKANETATKALAFTGDTFADEEALKDALVKVIKANNIELRTLLRGNDGAKGEKGYTGETGANGDMKQYYGLSIVKNSALALGTAQYFTGGFTLGEVYKGLKSFNVTGLAESDFFPFNKERILKLSFYVKAITGSPRVFFYNFDDTNTVVTKSNGALSTFLDPVVTSGVWTKLDLYFAGVGTNPSSFSESSHLKLFLSSVSGNSNILYNRVIVEQVPLGDAVPHNLPYLPLNQTVLNNTTGKVGIYNGTTVDYYM